MLHNFRNPDEKFHNNSEVVMGERLALSYSFSASEEPFRLAIYENEERRVGNAVLDEINQMDLEF